MECLDYIIGLSRTTCECLTDNLPADSDSSPSDYNISRSGIYLDELEGFNIEVASGGEDCAEGGIWEIMARAVLNAKQDFIKSLLGCIGTKYQPRLKNFTWQLGQSTFTGTLNNLVTTHAGMRISPAQIKGGFIYIKKIGVIINQAAPVTVQVYSDKDGGTLIFENSSTPINTTANMVTWATLSDPLELPMWDNNGNYIRYYVLMLLNGTFKPKANKRDCGCGGKKNPYEQFIEIAGVSGNYVSGVTDITNLNVDGQTLDGITVEVDVKCKASELICSDEYPLDFDNDGDALNKATAIQLRAGARVYEYLLSSPNINRFTMLNREQQAKNIDRWNAQYQEALLGLCDNVDVDVNDCMICKTTNTTLQKNLIKATGKPSHY